MRLGCSNRSRIRSVRKCYPCSRYEVLPMSPGRTCGFLERAMGIEPTSEAWEAYLKARKRANWRHFCVFRCSSNGFQLEQPDRRGCSPHQPNWNKAQPRTERHWIKVHTRSDLFGATCLVHDRNLLLQFSRDLLQPAQPRNVCHSFYPNFQIKMIESCLNSSRSLGW